VQLISNRLVLFAGAGCWQTPTQPKLVKKIAANHNEKILDKDWLRRRGGTFCCDGVRSTAGSVFEHTRTSGPELTNPDIACVCNPDIACASLPEVGIARNPDIAHARGYASRKST